MDSRNRYLVTAKAANSLQIFSCTGQLLQETTLPSPGPIQVDRIGRIVVLTGNRRMQVLSITKKGISPLWSFKLSNLEYTDIALGADGRILVCSTKKIQWWSCVLKTPQPTKTKDEEVVPNQVELPAEQQQTLDPPSREPG